MMSITVHMCTLYTFFSRIITIFSTNIIYKLYVKKNINIKKISQQAFTLTITPIKNIF